LIQRKVRTISRCANDAAKLLGRDDGMTTATVRRLLVAATGAALISTASAAAGLTPQNYVDAGDTIVEMLDTSALAFSTMLLGLNDSPPLRPTAFAAHPPGVQTMTTPCPGGGSVSGRAVDRDASGDLSVRDRSVTSLNACRIENETFTGSSEFVITAHRFEPEYEFTELEFHFHDLGSDAIRWSGPARATLKVDRRTGAEQYVVTYQDMVVTRGTRSYRWNFTLEMQRPPLGDHIARIEGLMTLEHEPLRLVQDDSFVIGPSGKPRSGQLTASDAQGNRLQAEAGARRYAYRFYARSNHGEVPDARSFSTRRVGR